MQTPSEYFAEKYTTPYEGGVFTDKGKYKNAYINFVKYFTNMGYKMREINRLWQHEKTITERTLPDIHHGMTIDETVTAAVKASAPKKTRATTTTPKRKTVRKPKKAITDEAETTAQRAAVSAVAVTPAQQETKAVVSELQTVPLTPIPKIWENEKVMYEMFEREPIRTDEKEEVFEYAERIVGDYLEMNGYDPLKTPVPRSYLEIVKDKYYAYIGKKTAERLMGTLRDMRSGVLRLETVHRPTNKPKSKTTKGKTSRKKRINQGIQALRAAMPTVEFQNYLG